MIKSKLSKKSSSSTRQTNIKFQRQNWTVKWDDTQSLWLGDCDNDDGDDDDDDDDEDDDDDDNNDDDDEDDEEDVIYI